MSFPSTSYLGCFILYFGLFLANICLVCDSVVDVLTPSPLLGSLVSVVVVGVIGSSPVGLSSVGSDIPKNLFNFCFVFSHFSFFVVAAPFSPVSSVISPFPSPSPSPPSPSPFPSPSPSPSGGGSSVYVHEPSSTVALGL